MNQNLSINQSESSHAVRMGHLSGVTVGSDFLLGDLMGKYKYGLCKHLLYPIWAGMKTRCYNPNILNYKDYGGRGIKVCQTWKNDPAKFIHWALKNGWRKGLYLDRKNNGKGYSPNNCRFVDSGLNSRNTRLLRKDNTTGYRGVHFKATHQKFVAQIMIQGERKHLGLFSKALSAAFVYDSMVNFLNDGRPTNFKKGKNDTD